MLLARKHPVPFFQFLDCCARSHQADAVDHGSRICSLLINACTKIGTKAMAELPNSPAATAALASALTSTLKLYAATAADLARRHEHDIVWPAVYSCTNMPMLLLEVVSGMLQHVPCCAFHHALLEEAAVGKGSPETSSSSSSSTVETEQQQVASTLLLLVLVCRSLVVLHELLLQLPQMSWRGLDAQMHDDDASAVKAAGVGSQELLTKKQHEFAAKVLRVFANVRTALHSCFRVQQAATAAAAVAAERTDGQAAGHTASQHASSSSSSNSRRVRWQYLLRLQESRKLMNALHTLDSVWSADAAATTSCNSTAAAGSSEQPELTQQQLQQFRAALQFCRVLVAVAPLPVVCNNPGCVRLGGASEAAAARFMCAGCGCRYCSAACQAAGWRGHKKACRRMADCGMSVQG
jgi:hypothetical protein